MLEKVEVIFDTHFFNEFSGTKGSLFPRKVISCPNTMVVNMLKKSLRTLNCSPKTMKIIREIQDSLLCVGKRKELITKTKAEVMCWCSKSGLR